MKKMAKQISKRWNSIICECIAIFLTSWREQRRSIGGAREGRHEERGMRLVWAYIGEWEEAASWNVCVCISIAFTDLFF